MTIRDRQVDIAIIGGGMVGASLALLLARSLPDWRIALIEARPLAPASGEYPARADARSTALSYGSSRILARLGIWDALTSHATPITRVHVSDRGHLAGSLIEASREGVPALGYVVENPWLGRQLALALQDHPRITCLAPARVEACEPQPGGSRLDVADQAGTFYLDASLTVIADGGDSPLRRRLGIDARMQDYDQTAIIANVDCTKAHGGTAYERFTDHGPLALLPLGDSPAAKRMALVWTRSHDSAKELVAVSDAEFLARLQARFGQRLGRFIAVGERQAYPLQLVTAGEQIRSGLVLLGNAAHFLHPVAGQGFNLALRDCAALAETLADAARQGRSPGDLRVLQQYLDNQQLDQDLTIAFSDRLVRLFSSSRLPLIALRHLGLLSLDYLPPLKHWLARQTLGQAGRDYRWDANHCNDNRRDTGVGTGKHP